MVANSNPRMSFLKSQIDIYATFPRDIICKSIFGYKLDS